MVAKGHEVIETIVSKYLLNFLDHYYPKQSASIKTFLPKEEDFTRVFYFGNWMTDMSQFFVPDGFNKIRGNIDNLVIDYNKYIQTFKVKLSIIIKDEIIETFKNKIIEALPSYSGGPTMPLPEPANSIAQFITPLIVQNQDKIKIEIEKLCESIKNGTDEELNKIFTNLTLDETKVSGFFKKYLGKNPKEFKYVDYNDPMWHLANVFVKIMGFKKYCLGDNPISFIQFEELYNIVLDSTSGSLFNLMQYYPSDHLDRPYTINTGQKTSNRPQRDFIDKGYKKYDSEGMYDYMKDYRTILSGKFSRLQQDFIMPYFINNKSLNRRTVLSLLSKLGIGLHMLEDFYSHSNFYELSLRFMQGKKLNEQKYYSYNEYFKLDERNIYKEFARIHNTTNLPTEDDKNTIIEDKLYTGYYTFEDTLVSIFHLITDGIVRKIETIDIGPYIEKRLELESDKSNKLIENEPEGEFSIDVLEALAGLASGISRIKQFNEIEFANSEGINTQSFNVEAFDFLMKDYLKGAKINITIEDKNKVIDLVNVIFSTINFIREGKRLKNDFQDLLEFYEFLKLLLTILTLEIQVTRIFKIIAFKLAKTIFGIIPGLIRRPFYELMNDWLKESMLAYVEMVENQVNSLLKSYPGSHSFVAKDEVLHKRLTHFQVTKMAGFADMFVLDNLFLNNTPQTVCSMNDTIKYVFHNPNDGMNRLSAMPDERNHTSIVEFYSINVLQNTPMNKVYQDFMKGLNKNSINTKSDEPLRRFLSENPNVFKEDMISLYSRDLRRSSFYTQSSTRIIKSFPRPNLFPGSVWDFLNDPIKRTIFHADKSKAKPEVIFRLNYPAQSVWQIFKYFEGLKEPYRELIFKKYSVNNIEILDNVNILSGRSWSNYFYRKDFLQFGDSYWRKLLSDEQLKKLEGILDVDVTMNYEEFDNESFYDFLHYVFQKERDNILQQDSTSLKKIVSQAQRLDDLVKNKYIGFISKFVSE